MYLASNVSKAKDFDHITQIAGPKLWLNLKSFKQYFL